MLQPWKRNNDRIALRIAASTGPELTAVFAERFIADIVDAILDRPVAAPEVLQFGGADQGLWQAGQAIGHFRLEVADAQIEPATGAAEHLSNIGLVQVVIEGGCAGQLPGFQAAVLFLLRLTGHAFVGSYRRRQFAEYQFGRPVQGGLVFS